MQNNGQMIEPILDDNSGSSRTWRDRTFSPLKKESMRSAIFAMLMSAIGLGVFSFHKLFDEVGIIAAIILILVYGGFNYMCAQFVVTASREAGEAKSLGELAKSIIGPKYLVFFDIVLFLSLLTTLVAQLMSVAKVLFSNFGLIIFEWLKVSEANRTEDYFIFWAVIILSFLLLVLLLLNPADKMGYASMIAFLIFLGLSILSLVQAPMYYQQNGHNLNVTGFTFYGYFHRCGLLVFAYNCIYNYYTVANNLDQPTQVRLQKVFSRTFGVLVGLFVLMGTVFYLSLGPVESKKIDLFINRDKIGSTDYFMITFRSLFAVSLLISYILTVEPCKAITGRFLAPKMNHYVSSVLFTVGPAIIAITFKDITNFIGVSGAALTTIIVFTTPALLALFSGRYTQVWQKALLVLFIGYTLLSGLYGSYLSFLDMGKKN
jgi:amino acid permease